MKTYCTRAIALSLVALGIGLSGCNKGKSQQAAAPIKIGAIFARTGGAAPLGGPEARTAEMLVEKLNAAGGVNGRKIQLIVKDSATSPEKALSLAKQLIEEEKVLAIIGPSTSGETMAIKNLCQESKTILLSCAAAEEIVNPVASYVFKTPQKDSDAARLIFQTMKARGLTKIGLVSANDGFGKAGNTQLTKLAPDYGITLVISETYDKQETDLTGVLTKIKGAAPEAVINWSIVPAQSLVAKNMRQIKLDVPMFQSHGFGNIKYVRDAGEAANGTLFPCGRLLIADSLPDTHPQKAVLMAYKKEYESRHKGEEASSFGGYAYDALLILTEAIKKAGSAEGGKVRDAIEGLTGVAGISGMFNFSPQDHNGLALDSFEMLTVKDGKFAIYKSGN